MSYLFIYSSPQLSHRRFKGNSLIRGPSDVVDTILSSVSPSYDPAASDPAAIFPCTMPHTLAFEIGGKVGATCCTLTFSF